MSESTDGLTAVEEAVEEVEEDVEALRELSQRSGWFRVEYAILGLLSAMFLAYVIAYFVLGANLESLKDWGYLGIFLIAMAGSATIVLPTPSTVAIFSGGVLLDPVMGIPAPLLVGLVAGLGDAIGELSGYGLGFAGADLIKQRRIYSTFERWMGRNGMLTIFALSTFPNPFFDIAGAAAGASRMQAPKFFVATLAGKIVKDLFLAYGGSFSVGLASDVL
ncbi:MAG TPA: VTT domain-containing protein [Dehalococcoidia bacterium]|nr:VTT domain-containing protein [Dehalococcoidia bacterium]